MGTQPMRLNQQMPPFLDAFAVRSDRVIERGSYGRSADTGSPTAEPRTLLSSWPTLWSLITTLRLLATLLLLEVLDASRLVLSALLIVLSRVAVALIHRTLAPVILASHDPFN